MRILCIILLFCLYIKSSAQNDTGIVEKVVQSQPTDEGKDSVFFTLFVKYAWTKPDSALYYSKKEALLAKQLNSTLMISRAFSRHGYVLGLMGNYPQGIDYLLRSQQMAEQVKDSTWMYWNYVFLTEINTDRGDFKQARLYAEKFKELRSRYDNSLEQWYVRMAIIYQKSGLLDSALLYGVKAWEEEIRVKGKPAWTVIPLTLAGIYAKRKMYDSALHYYRITLSLSFEDRLYKELIVIYNGIAEVYRNTGKSDSSFYYAYKSLNLRSTNAYPLGTISTYHVLYNLFRDKGNADSAIRYLEQTIALKDSLFNQQKEREVQNIAFNEQLRQQDAIAQRIQYRNKLKLYTLLSIAVTFIMVALLLWRNIQHRKKAYALLQNQKAATDRQREKTEQAMHELKLMQRQLIQSEKMASLGQLTAGIAHEIQNPLNFVNNFSEINTELINELEEEAGKGNLEEVLAITNDLKENEQKINLHGKRADSIVKGMLQHSRVSSGKKELADINALVDESLRLSYHGFRAKDKVFNAQIKTDLDNSIGKINVVPQDVSRVLLNLFNNAFYAVKPPIPLKGEHYEPTVWVCTKKLDGKVEIHVKDNGNGIPENIIDKIFQPFFTTKPTGQGTGLGLSLSYDIIKAHGGEIRVESKEGEGTDFIIQLSANNT